MEVKTQLTSFLLKCKRVWHAMKKPTKKEYTQVAKVSAIGVAILGVIGFAISILIGYFF